MWYAGGEFCAFAAGGREAREELGCGGTHSACLPSPFIFCGRVLRLLFSSGRS
jgi:hypothetical protein